jgi:hypothetical protein
LRKNVLKEKKPRTKLLGGKWPRTKSLGGKKLRKNILIIDYAIKALYLPLKRYTEKY